MNLLKRTCPSTFICSYNGRKMSISSPLCTANRLLCSLQEVQNTRCSEDKVKTAAAAATDSDLCTKLQDRHESWAHSMTNRYAAMAREQPTRKVPSTIYRVPSSIRQEDNAAYEPILLSIGPYHRGKEGLQNMEEHKWRNLHAILTQHPKTRLSDYLKEIEALEDEVRSCYSEVIDFQSQDFVETMVLDGCFILALFLSQEKEGTGEWSNPIYRTRWVLPKIIHDMLLLENQIPLSVLHRLFELIIKSTTITSSLVDLALRFFDLHPTEDDLNTLKKESFHHLLHLYHSHQLLHLAHFSRPSKVFKRSLVALDLHHKPSLKSIPSATQIHDAGILFRTKDDSPTILDVELKSITRWVMILRIPTMCINDYTNSLLRNLIALEQCNPEHGTYYTSHAIFMNCLIDAPEDVALLKRHHIIEHGLGSDEEVAVLFNRLCRGINLHFEQKYLDIFKEVNRSHGSHWKTLRATIKRDYSKDPISMLKIIFALFCRGF